MIRREESPEGEVDFSPQQPIEYGGKTCSCDCGCQLKITIGDKCFGCKMGWCK